MSSRRKPPHEEVSVRKKSHFLFCHHTWLLLQMKVKYLKSTYIMVAHRAMQRFESGEETFRVL